MKKKINTMPLVYPIPIVLIGTQKNGRNNFTTIGDVAIMGINPPLVVISLLDTHLSTEAVLLNRCFSINIPNTDLLQKTDYCGMYSGRDADKASLFEVVYGDNPLNPLIEECPCSMECEVLKHHIVERRHIFIAKVCSTWLDEKFKSQMQNKSLPDLCNLDPVIYGMDNAYYSIGHIIGKGYQEGKQIIHQRYMRMEEGDTNDFPE